MTIWSGTATALSSILHVGETRATTSTVRRERVLQPDGSSRDVPIISGNAIRGTLRRHAEQLLRSVLHYEGSLTLPAAHALVSGGSLTKTTSEPLSGARLRTVRELIPVIGIFGAAAAGRIIDGTLQVGKLVPHIGETAHLTGIPSSLTAFDIVQVEQYTRNDDTNSHDFPQVDGDAPTDTIQMLYRVETIRPGTVFSCWFALQHATPLQEAFFGDLLAAFSLNAQVGGRIGIGHGRLRLDLTPDQPVVVYDWAAELTARRDEALSALAHLT